MYSVKLDAVSKEIIIKSLNGQLRILQDKIITGDESPETQDLYERVSKAHREVLYSKAIKKEGFIPSQDIPN